MESRYLALLPLLIVGLVSIYAGISGTLGYRRQTYIFPHYYSGGINYASIPGGIMCLLWAFAVIVSLFGAMGKYPCNSCTRIWATWPFV